LTIEEILQGYENVSSQPKLAVTNVPVFDVGDQHFQILLDADGLIGPDGNAIPILSVVQGTSNKQQATTVVDTGFSFSQVSKSVADAIYSRFSGAEYVNVSDVGTTWIVPCDQEVNITFKFGGQSYLVHPLDTTLDPTIVGIKDVQNSKGQSSCLGTFQPFSFDNGPDPNYDMILGMSFLRNVYALINFGDFVQGGTSKDNPFIQFLTTTQASEAHSDFVKVRLGGVDTTNPNSTQNPPSKNSPRTLIYVVAAAVAAGALIIVGIALVVRARKSQPRKGGAALGSYRPLQDPVDMHVMSAQQPYDPPPQQYNQPQYNQYQYNQQQYGQQPYDPQPPYNPNAQYQSPWDHRR